MTSPELRRLLLWSGGTVLVMIGLRRRSVGGIAVAIVGEVMALRAAAGCDDLGAVDHWRLGRRYHRTIDPLDRVSETLAESFPASDPPSWTATTGVALAKGSASSKVIEKEWRWSS